MDRLEDNKDKTFNKVLYSTSGIYRKHMLMRYTADAKEEYDVR